MGLGNSYLLVRDLTSGYSVLLRYALINYALINNSRLPTSRSAQGERVSLPSQKNEKASIVSNFLFICAVRIGIDQGNDIM